MTAITVLKLGINSRFLTMAYVPGPSQSTNEVTTPDQATFFEGAHSGLCV